MLGYADISQIKMTYCTRKNTLSTEEFNEMIALRNAIHELPQSVSPHKMEKFTEYLVRSLREKGG